MKWLFGSKKKKIESGNVRKVGKRILHIKSLDMLGPFSESEDCQFLLVREDADRDRGIGGYRDSGNGRFALINNGNINFVGECERPTGADVANTGTFAIVDTLFGDKLGSKLYVYSADGELLLEHLFTANTFNIGISVDGTYVIVQLCGSDTDDSGRLYLFDVYQSTVVSAFVPETGWAKKYFFSVPEKIVCLFYKEKRQYRYRFDGDFFDEWRYKRERIEDATPREVVLIVKENLSSVTHEELPDLLSVINGAFDGNLSQYHDYQALAYRLRGEIYECLGNAQQAVADYQEALGINPKIGVKRRLKKLENEISESG